MPAHLSPTPALVSGAGTGFCANSVSPTSRASGKHPTTRGHTALSPKTTLRRRVDKATANEPEISGSSDASGHQYLCCAFWSRSKGKALTAKTTRLTSTGSKDRASRTSQGPSYRPPRPPLVLKAASWGSSPFSFRFQKRGSPRFFGPVPLVKGDSVLQHLRPWNTKRKKVADKNDEMVRRRSGVERAIAHSSWHGTAQSMPKYSRSSSTSTLRSPTWLT